MMRATGMPTQDLRLRGILRLRWGALAGYVVVIAWCEWLLQLPLPLGALSLLLALLVVTQVLGTVASRRLSVVPPTLIASLLVCDTLVLTGVLYLTGGARNPFSVFYLLQIAVAASLLGAAWTWTLLSLAVGSFAALFWVNVPLPLPMGAAPGSGGMSEHFTGMFVAMALTGACLAWFVARLNMQLREREMALQQARLREEQKSRFASIVTLAAGVAHEINSPLATIAIAARELEVDLARMGPSGSLADDARLIRSEVERCRAILGRLRAEGAEPGADADAPLDAAGIMRAVRDALPAEYRARLRGTQAEQLPKCKVQEAALVQALSNLVRNAFEASPPEAAVTLDVAVHDGAIRFTVSDRGPGLPASVAPRAGEPFVTTKEPGQGTGLGLFLVRRFADDVGGRFTIQSRPGAGTQAVLDVPYE